MTYVLTQPQLLAAAAANVAGIGATIDEANAAAASPTIGVMAAAADEVSTASAELFSVYARDYQAVVSEATAFHHQFAQMIGAAGGAYAEAEAAAQGALGAVTMAAHLPETAANITVFVGGTGTVIPPPSEIAADFNLYVGPYFPGFTLANAFGLATPAGLYPATGVKSLPLEVSVSQGTTILNNTLVGSGGLIIPGGNNVVVFGHSQSTMIASLEMEALAAMPNPPSASQLSFVLTGDPLTPNGGVYTRFPFAAFPSLGFGSYGPTPPNTIYTTHIYTIEYDGLGDWPQYPIDFLADVNAVMGVQTVHPLYTELNPSALPPGYTLQTLPTSPGYAGATTYYMITNPNLPLLNPVRAIPFIGNPLADLLQPDLTYLVNWGYGNPDYGYSTGPADVPTPMGLFPPLSATQALAPDLVGGTQQGIAAAFGAFRAEGPPSLPAWSAPDMSNLLVPSPLATVGAGLSSMSSGSFIDNFITSLQTANTNIADTVSSSVATAYSVLLPTADIANALLIAMPAMDVNLFLDGILQAVNGQPVAGLINAIGLPIAANIGLGTYLAGIEFTALAYPNGVWDY